MAEQESKKQQLYKIQAFLFDYEEAGEKYDEDEPNDEYNENQKKYIQFLKLLAREKGLDFISEQLNNPDITFQETLKRWNPVLTFLISDALSDLEPDKKHRLFLKKVSDMTGYEYREYLKYLKEDNI